MPAVVLATAITAYPAAGRLKLPGLAIGIPLLLGLNVAREAVIILAVVGLWLTWAAWADRAARRYRSVSQRSSSTVTVVPESGLR